MSNRDNKTAAAEFRDLVGVNFEEFTRQAPGKLLLALSKFAHRLILQRCNFPSRQITVSAAAQRLVRALRHAWQHKGTATTERRRQITEVVSG